MFRADSHSPCPHQRTASGSSADTAPEVAPKTPKLGMASMANLFVRARRAEDRIHSRQLLERQQKPGQTILTSGEPQTHPSVERCLKPDQPRVPVEFAEAYICSGGVNVVPLLVASRAALLDRAEVALGAGTLTDEQWECIITSVKPHSSGIYKVQVRYLACATKSSARNPQRIVCVEQARGIPGLMTVVKRCSN